MVVRQTSRDAYRSVNLTARQEDVFDALRALGEATDEEIAAHLGWGVNRITGRRGELVELKLAERVRLTRGPLGRTVSVWRAKPHQMSLFGAEMSRRAEVR